MAENKKSGKGLVITLVILVVAFAACAALLFTGVIKSPMVKCEDKTTEKTETKTDDTTKKEESKKEDTTVKETRYYQLYTKTDDAGNLTYNQFDTTDSTLIDYKSAEIILNTDGTYESYVCGASSGHHFKGKYVENDNFIVLIGNLPKECKQGLDCTELSYLIKNPNADELMFGTKYDYEEQISTNLLEFDSSVSNVLVRTEKATLKCAE